MNMAPRKGTRRACDPCSVRKVRCDGNQPCARCQTANWDCTYLKTHGKSGPKGPRRTTEAAIRRFQERSRSDLSLPHGANSDSDTSVDDGSPTTIEFPPSDQLPPISEPPLGWPDAAYPPLQGYRGPQKVSTSTISPYLETYQARGYAIWPVVDTESLLARLLTDPDDMEAYALATAICAATITQFQIDAEPGSPVEGHFRVSSAMFDSEAKRAREDSDHSEHVTVSSLLGAFFLHVYAANIGRMSTSTIYLGEAITKAHMVGLHKPSYYQNMDIERLQYNVRIYWLLFITERAHSIQNDVPTMLKRSSEIPQLEDLNDGSVTLAFIQLCRLFSILDATLTADPTGARSALALAQQQLDDDSRTRSLNNVLQRADISMTQQWMRIFLWQHALSVTNLRSSDQDDGFSFAFPAKVAQNALSFLCTLPKESLEAHGPGMESKLFDIANSLADVMICVPSLNQDSGFGMGPRDLIHSLSSLLGSFRGGNPAVTRVLQDKLTTLGLSISSPQRRLIDISSSDDERDDWRAGTPRSLTWSDNGAWQSQLTPLSPSFPNVLSSL